MRFSLIGLVSLLMASHTAMAAWTLDNTQSQLNFISIKKDHIAETHQFNALKGAIGDDGKASFSIEMASVETHIDIRNQRMKDHLFEVAQYPVASFSADVDVAALKKMKMGASQAMDIKGLLSIHGVEQPVQLAVTVNRTMEGLVVSSSRPFVVNAKDYAMESGVDQLKQIAKLPMISLAVPVTFSLTFK